MVSQEKMSAEAVEAFLSENAGKLVEISWIDGKVDALIIDTPDQEGFLHSGPDGVEPRRYWSRFTGVAFARNLPS